MSIENKPQAIKNVLLLVNIFVAFRQPRVLLE